MFFYVFERFIAANLNHIQLNAHLLEGEPYALLHI